MRTAEEAAAINQQIDVWNAKADAIKNAGKAVDNGPLWKDDASTIKDISDNIEILNKQLQTASIDEAAAINQQIDVWNAKADAIKNAGREAEKTGTSVGKSLKSGWGAIKGMASSVESITEALKGNGSAWQIVCGIVDGFIGLYEGIQTVIGIINLLSAASAAHAATKGVEATAEGTEQRYERPPPPLTRLPQRLLLPLTSWRRQAGKSWQRQSIWQHTPIYRLPVLVSLWALLPRCWQQLPRLASRCWQMVV